MYHYSDLILWDSTKGIPDILKRLIEDGVLDVKIRKPGEWDHLPEEVSALITESTFRARRKKRLFPFLPPRYEKVKVMTKFREIQDGDVLEVYVLRTFSGKLIHYSIAPRTQT